VHKFKRTELDNGIKVLTETIPHVRSVTVGAWIAAGSRYEPAPVAGVSHFLEHLLFKGTENRTSREISLAIDAVGGQLNAFTSKEYTCYYARVLDEHFPLGFEVLSDMLRYSLLDPKDIENEKGVVLEEIRMYEDAPDDLVHVVFGQTLWPDHPLGRPVVGAIDTVASMSPEEIHGFFDLLYSPANTVIVVAGHVDHNWVVDQVEQRLGGWSRQHQPMALDPPESHRAVTVRRKETEQAHLVVGGPGVSIADRRLYVMSVLSTILGGGTSSRLFQEVREERGLAYSIYTFTSTYRDAGLLGIYAGTSPGRVEEVLDVLTSELNKIQDEGLEEGELERNKEQLKGNLMLSLESTSSRMMRLGKTELLLGHVYSPDDIVGLVDAVTEAEVVELAGELLSREQLSLALVGPIDEAPQW